LVWSSDISKSAVEIRNAIELSAINLPEVNSPKNNQFGEGRLDALGALQLILPELTINDVSFDQPVYSPGAQAEITVILSDGVEDAYVDFTCNSQTYSCQGVGEGAYSMTFNVPSTVGTYPIIVNADKTGYTSAEPYNLILNVENIGNSPYPPYINLTLPNNDICHNECFITWDAVDPDNNAVIYLYYDNNNYGLNGTCINPGNPLFENSASGYSWNTVNMPEGVYWIYATIDDGTTLNSDYSPGYIEINHPDLSSDLDTPQEM
jgi:hypothetical protein